MGDDGSTILSVPFLLDAWSVADGKGPTFRCDGLCEELVSNSAATYPVFRDYFA
jgi:hypothetical protein